MSKAVFLDRDGVINREVGDYIMRTEDFYLLDHALNGISRLSRNGYKIIVITNQGGLAKGLYSEETLEEMHAIMREKVSTSGGHIDEEIYYCPHHPDFGVCLCRKPASLMVEKAIARFGINPSESLFIGDKDRDIVCAAGAGVQGVLIRENEDWTFAVDELLK